MTDYSCLMLFVIGKFHHLSQYPAIYFSYISSIFSMFLGNACLFQPLPPARIFTAAPPAVSV